MQGLGLEVDVVEDTAVKRDPLGHALYEDIVRRVRAGELQQGDALLNVRDLSQAYGISVRATLKALDRLEDEGWIERRRGAGSFVRKASRRTRRRTARIGLVRDTEATSFAGVLASMASDAVHGASDLDVLELASDEGLPSQSLDCVLVLQDSQARGLTFPVDAALVHVSPEFFWAPARASGVDMVSMNYRHAASLAGGHLREQGAVCPLVVGAYWNRPDGSDAARLAAFANGWGEEIPAERILDAVAHHPSCGARVVPRILAHADADAVFCTTDDIAIGVCHGLLAHDKQPGRDIKVMGLDGQPAGRTPVLDLTSAEIDADEFARTVVEAVRYRCAHPQAPVRHMQVGCRVYAGHTA